MLIDVVCPICAARHSFLPEQEGSVAVCGTCGERMVVNPPELEFVNPVHAATTQAGSNKAAPPKILELGPGWRGIARGLHCLRFAYMVWLVLIPLVIPLVLIATLLAAARHSGERQNPGTAAAVSAIGLIGVVCACLVCVYGFALLLGRLLCISVPARAKCLDLGALSFIATLSAPILMGAGIFSLIAGMANQGVGGDIFRLLAFDLSLGGLAAWMVGDVIFLGFLYRLGRFLQVADMGARVRGLAVMLVVSSVLTLIGVLVPIDPVPSQQSYEPVQVYLTLGVVMSCLVLFVFGFNYRGALGAGIAAIASARSPR